MVPYCTILLLHDDRDIGWDYSFTSKFKFSRETTLVLIYGTVAEIVLVPYRTIPYFTMLKILLKIISKRTISSYDEEEFKTIRYRTVPTVLGRMFYVSTIT